ncbi:efflux RND transporter periplasmic adaptor subunit [Sphingobium yanoikuyae]|nr:efflux RND transporter periplasmic adaptor subunit [Sphingobium yanoikuyae]QNG43954.1 efflux RND transporter periplasmic adaptor subunit [Sphingobium yanoikuyae]
MVVSQAAAVSGTMASGTVEADDRAQLVARASGTVRAASLHEGQRVRRGQILATIDARQADAALEGARAGLAAAMAEQRDAHGDVVRDAPLAQSGALSGDAYRAEQLRHEAAVARVAQAQAALAAARVDRAYTSIISPVDGVVVARHIRDGDMAMPGTPLVTVEGRGQLLFRFAAPQSALSGFVPGNPVPVLLDGREDRPVSGRVRGVVPSADPATRRFTVEVLLPRDSGVMPGMFGRVALPSAEAQADAPRAVRVPAAAVVDRGGLTGVFVVGKDRRLTFRWVRLGDRAGDQLAVTSGLSAGERILARVDPAVRDGARLAQGAAR